jgi:hypothetical protein
MQGERQSESSDRGRGHVVAGIRAALAHFSAKAHLVVCLEALARLRAAFANLGAHGAGEAMKGGFAEHEVAGDLADFSAIEQQADVLSGGVFAAAGEAMVEGRDADSLRIAAVLDALLHVKGGAVLVIHS